MEVKHVIVCGHYGCGGINAALENKQVGIIDNWLRHIKDVYRLHKDEIDAIQDIELKSRRMVEINVQEQVFDLSKTSIIQNAWAKNQTVYIHGIVYDVSNGILKDLNLNISNNQHLDSVYKLDIDQIIGNH